MLDSLCPELNLSSEDPATPEVSRFFKLLKDSEEPLHEHTDVSILAFVTRLMAIKQGRRAHYGPVLLEQYLRPAQIKIIKSGHPSHCLSRHRESAVRNRKRCVVRPSPPCPAVLLLGSCPAGA
jgi:hypothetical protein